MEPRTIDTEMALIERDEHGIIRIRVKQGQLLSVKGFGESIVARRELAEGKPARVIALVPEDTDFEIGIMSMDHYDKVDAAAFTKAFAIVTDTSLFVRMYAIYNNYFKLTFPVKIFATEAEALAWLDGFPD